MNPPSKSPTRKTEETIGEVARETMTKIYAEKEALQILKERHYEEYRAIYKKRHDIFKKKWWELSK